MKDLRETIIFSTGNLVLVIYKARFFSVIFFVMIWNFAGEVL